ncbi:MAG: FHA domain-containing protein [Lachnospiraceae bacterium]|nr:FHA domain-containing protein [Lachnospiraceae bacterium]
MNLKRCENGHFYDTDKYSACPHCSGEGVKSDDNLTVTVPMDRSNDVTIPETMPVNQQRLKGFPEMGGVPTDSSADSNLKAFINQSNIETVPVEDSDKTVRYSAGTTKIEPVVGWLVAVSGEMAGESYLLKAGRNFIGRGANMDVVLSGDKSVSRDKHAIILYEPRKREFLVQPGESRELFYLNDEVVLNTIMLNAYDKLLIGATELIFVPFCGEKFGWDDLDKTE